MKIGITGFGCDGGFSGISVYLRELLKEFESAEHEFEFELICHPDEREGLVPHLERVRVIEMGDVSLNPLRNVIWHRRGFVELVRRRRWDLVFFPAANRRLAGRLAVPTVGTIHDVAGLKMSGKYDWMRQVYLKRYLPRMMRKLDRVLTVSEFSRKDIVENIGVSNDRIIVTPLASRLTVEQGLHLEDEVLAHFQIKRPYFLYVSRLEHPAKNHLSLIEAFERLPESLDVELVLAGGDAPGAEVVRRRVAESSRAARIRILGFVPDTDLAALYSNALAVVMPSLYEGFGLGVVEAMRCGAPVAIADRTSLPEVAGDAALRFDPSAIPSIVEVLIRLGQCRDTRAELSRAGKVRAQQFSWRRTAELTLSTFRSCLDEENLHAV